MREKSDAKRNVCEVRRCSAELVRRCGDSKIWAGRSALGDGRRRHRDMQFRLTRTRGLERRAVGVIRCRQRRAIHGLFVRRAVRRSEIGGLQRRQAGRLAPRAGRRDGGDQEREDEDGDALH